MSSAPAAGAAYDRVAELRALDATLAGVRGLVASGATRVPRLFRAADPEQLQPQPPPPPQPSAPGQEEALLLLQPPRIPTVDLGAADRDAVVAAVRRAAAEWGLFLVTGHGVPAEVAAAALGAARAFHDAAGGEGTEKARLYTRDPARAVKYNCNFDLYDSAVANWRDTLYLRIAPDPPADAEMPENCRTCVLASFPTPNHTICKNVDF
ncbi:unnamed protein product [Urochloa humidicola]